MVESRVYTKFHSLKQYHTRYIIYMAIFFVCWVFVISFPLINEYDEVLTLNNLLGLSSNTWVFPLNQYNLLDYSVTSTIQTLSNEHAFKESCILQESSYELGVDEVRVTHSLSTFSTKECAFGIASNWSLLLCFVNFFTKSIENIMSKFSSKSVILGEICIPILASRELINPKSREFPPAVVSLGQQNCKNIQHKWIRESICH